MKPQITTNELANTLASTLNLKNEATFKEELAQLIQNHTGSDSHDFMLEFNATMVDWKITQESTESMQAGDDQEYQAKIKISDSISMDYFDQHGEPVLGFISNIANGAPGIWFDTGGDTLMGVQSTNEGLEVFPCFNGDKFFNAKPSRFNANSLNGLLLLK